MYNSEVQVFVTIDLKYLINNLHNIRSCTLNIVRIGLKITLYKSRLLLNWFSYFLIFLDPLSIIAAINYQMSQCCSQNISEDSLMQSWK